MVPSAEEVVPASRDAGPCLRATTPERWRYLRAWANGVHVADIACRERIAVPSVYGRIDGARRDTRGAVAREDAAADRLLRE